MANTRRVIRKVQSPAELVVDEQFWPVMLALFLLCGFLMGTIAAYLPFGAKHWWQDARTWLFVIPLVTCGAVWMLRFLPSHVVRRALQISLVLGLLFHVFMLILSIEARIFGNLWQPTTRTRPLRPQRELRIVNDYSSVRLDQRQQQRQEMVQPIETPVPESVPEPIERQQERPERTLSESPPTPAPSTPRDIQRNVIERPTFAETKPRESEHLSKLSRQTTQRRPNPQEIVGLPISASSSAQPSSLDARGENVQQRPTETHADRMQVAVDPSTATPQQAAMTRRTTTEAPSASGAASAPLPRTASKARVSNPIEASSAPAQTPRSAVATAQQPAQQPAQNSAGAGSRLQQSSSAGAAAGGAVASAPTTTPTIATPSSQTSKNAGGGDMPSTTTTNHVVRATRRAALATSSTLAEAPSNVTADAGADQPIALPSRLAFTQSLGGVAGIGQTENLGRSPSTPGSPSTIASGAARRAQATQTMPPGPSLAPSAPALVRRSLVGAELPSASVRATTTGVAQMMGSERPAERNATSGASLVRQDANATRGDVTASKGSIDIDLGPTRVADAGGFERAGGGGQPIVNLDSASTNLARSRSGGTARFAVGTTTVDFNAASPVGGEQPAGGELGGSATDTKQAVTAGVGNPAAGKRAIELSAGTNGPASDGVASAGIARPNAAADVPTVGHANAGAAPTGDGKGRSPSNRAPNTGLAIGDVQTRPVPSSSTGKSDTSEAAAGGAASSPVVTQSTGNAAGGTSNMAREATPQSGIDVLLAGGPRSTVPGDTPTIGNVAVSSVPIHRATRAPLNAGPISATTAGIPSESTSVAVEESALKEASTGSDGAIARQQSASAPPIRVAAVDGAGGLGDRVAFEVGVNSRLATPDSIDVQTTPSRFMRQEVGGAPELSTSAVFATDAFSNRIPARSNLPIGDSSGSAGPQTEESIELGLSYLARRQLPDGSWTLHSPSEPVQLASDTAATGLCLLAFQGAGYSHREHKYATRVAAGIEYLVKNQKPDGDLFIPLDDISNRSVWLYSHGIAAIALCEAYGMTHDPALREPAQKALDFIIATQDPKGGGWRYQPGIESDTSVSGWMMMALKSGELAGLKVPPKTYDQIEKWLNVAQSSTTDRHLYRYNPQAPDTDTQRHGRNTSSTMTAVGLLMRLYGGWRRDHPNMVSGADHLRQHLPAIGTFREPLRDTYYWYYGTQVMFHMGGEWWEAWNGQLHPLLIESQDKQGETAGSWSPQSPVPDRWAPHAGRLYVTTMNLLSLEVTYRHLPLYVDTAK